MLTITSEVRDALADGRPVVALESTIISHGMPYPRNVEMATEVEGIVREHGAVPATIAVLGGRPRIGLTPDDLDAFVPHQANMRITDAMIKALGLPEHVPVARDIAETGNTSAASIPMAMARMLQEGQVASGGLALLIGFGAGLSYAAQVVELP